MAWIQKIIQMIGRKFMYNNKPKRPKPNPRPKR